ncbi:MraY family glycosyltransferase [uncultured Sunxiuqinia sp.]|uniref:MraY family glycosyltransferase n=1 Tax=Sunxiuqinia rutila TaxID=1397841 RepID=UPI00261BD26F|nr:MraY family glycosyltransferase [uncultured Sunxiuqinia sp.]
MSITLLSNIILSFIITYAVIPPIVRVSKAKNLMDVPDQRKLNKTVIPTLGGVAIFIGVNISTLVFLPNIRLTELRFLYAAIIMMFFTGLKDDLLIISARKKLMVQIAASTLLVVLGGFQITQAYGLGGISEFSPWVSIPLSIMVFLFLINAVNLIDGIDGLAAGIGVLVSATVGVWFYMTGFIGYAIISTALAASLLAYLRFNLWGNSNKIFMGDTGSLILGVLLGAIMIKFNELNVLTANPFHFQQAPLFVVAMLIVPITDTLRVFAVRIYHKKSPFSPDNNHIHHLLIKAGLSHIAATAFLIGYTALFALLALTFQLYINISVSFILLLSMSFSAIGWLNYKSKQYQKNQEKATEEESSKIIRLLPLGTKVAEEPGKLSKKKLLKV